MYAVYHANTCRFLCILCTANDVRWQTASKERTVKTSKYRLTDWNGAAAPEKKRKSSCLKVYYTYCTFILSYDTVIALQYSTMFYAFLHHFLNGPMEFHSNMSTCMYFTSFIFSCSHLKLPFRPPAKKIAPKIRLVDTAEHLQGCMDSMRWIRDVLPTNELGTAALRVVVKISWNCPVLYTNAKD